MEAPESWDLDSRRPLLPVSLVNLHQGVHQLLPGTKQRPWSPAQQGGAHGGRRAGRGRATTHFWVRDLKYTLPGRSPCFSGQRPEVGTCPLLSAMRSYLQKTHFYRICFLTSIHWMQSQWRTPSCPVIWGETEAWRVKWLTQGQSAVSAVWLRLGARSRGPGRGLGKWGRRMTAVGVWGHGRRGDRGKQAIRNAGQWQPTTRRWQPLGQKPLAVGQPWGRWLGEYPQSGRRRERLQGKGRRTWHP